MIEYLGPDQKLLEQAKNLWRVEGSFQLIRGNENWVYSLTGTSLIFRFTAKYHRTLPEIEAEIQWIDFLRRHHLKVVEPVVSAQGKYVQSLCDSWSVAVFENVNGRALKDEMEFNESLFFNWGKSIGEMHLLTKKYGKTTERRDWDKDDGFQLALNMVSVLGAEHFVVQKFLSLVETIRALPKTVDTFGLIHADVHHGNFFVDDKNQITIFDFDDAMYGYFMFDLAVPMEVLEIACRSGRWKNNLRKHQDIFIAGYKTKNTLPHFTNELLEIFIQYRCAHLYMWGTSRIHYKRTNDRPAIENMKSACENYLRSIDKN